MGLGDAVFVKEVMPTVPVGFKEADTEDETEVVFELDVDDEGELVPVGVFVLVEEDVPETVATMFDAVGLLEKEEEAVDD